MDWSTLEGIPFPLGATWVEEFQAWNFALYSKDAEAVTLLIYAEADFVSPMFTYQFDYLRNKSGRIWHCRLAQPPGLDSRNPDEGPLPAVGVGLRGRGR